MDHLRHQKYKNKQLQNSTLELENNFKPIISITLYLYIAISILISIIITYL